MAAGQAAPRLAAGAVERRLYVSAPPEVVWRVLHADEPGPDRDGLLILDPAAPGWPAAGSCRPGRIRLGIVSPRIAIESLDARPARRFRVAIRGTSVAGEARWELVGASGGTRVACAVHLDGISRLGRLLVRLGRGALGHRLEAELAGLKRAAEAEARPGTPRAS